MLLRVQLGAAQKFGMVPRVGAAAPLNAEGRGGEGKGGGVCGEEEDEGGGRKEGGGRGGGGEAALHCCERPGGFTATVRRDKGRLLPTVHRDRPPAGAVPMRRAAAAAPG